MLKLNANITMIINFLQKGKIKNLCMEENINIISLILRFWPSLKINQPGHLFTTFSELLFLSTHLWGKVLKSVSGLVFFSLPISKQQYKRFLHFRQRSSVTYTPRYFCRLLWILVFSFRLTAPCVAGVGDRPQDLLWVSCLPPTAGHWALAVPGCFKYSLYL